MIIAQSVNDLMQQSYKLFLFYPNIYQKNALKLQETNLWCQQRQFIASKIVRSTWQRTTDA